MNKITDSPLFIIPCAFGGMFAFFFVIWLITFKLG